MICKSAEKSGMPSKQRCQYLEHDDILFLEVSDTNVLFLERFLLLPAFPASLRLLVPIFLLQLPYSQPFPTIDFPPLSPGADGPCCTLHCSAGLEGGKCQRLIQLPTQRHPALLGMLAGNPAGFQLRLWKGTGIAEVPCICQPWEGGSDRDVSPWPPPLWCKQNTLRCCKAWRVQERPELWTHTRGGI